MDIIDRLKKEKKSKSVFDVLIKKKEKTEKKEEESKTKPSDIEVTQINQDKPVTAEKPVENETKRRPVTEFRTEGMHELDMESLGESGTANIKVEYKAKVSSLIDGDKLDEAIRLLLELKDKLAKKSEK